MSTYQRHLGKYELIEQRGSGASGDVWKAFDTEQKSFVALKILRTNQQGSSDLVTQFLRSAQRVASLRHPNIVPVLDLQVSLVPTSGNTLAYIVTEYVEGTSLDAYLRLRAETGTLPSANEITYLFTALGDALDAAHRQGIVHQNIKPSNILLDKNNTTNLPEGEPRLTDFGFNQMQQLLALPLNDIVYISPEQAQGFASNERSDIYSLGVILFQLCTGTPPFKGNTPAELMMQHIHALPPSATSLNQHISPALAAVIMRSLAKDPAARFPSASALAGALANAFNMVTPVNSSQPGFSRELLNGPTYLSSSQPGAYPGMTPSPQTLADSAPSYPRTSDPSPYTPGYMSQPSQPYLPTQMAQSQPYLQAQMAQSQQNMQTQMAQSHPSMQTQMAQSQPGILANNAMTPALSSAPGTSLPGIQSPAGVQPTGGPPPKRPRRRWPYILVAAILIIGIIGSALAAIVFLPRTSTAAAKPIVGHAFFVSSGQLGLFNNRGIADQVQINFQNIAAPAAGKSYYMWLLGDTDNDSKVSPVLLGQLTVDHGQASVFYKGDSQNTNLLISYSRFLVTEEDSGSTPSNPSLDSSNWRYYSAFSQALNPAPETGTGKNYSMLDHLRHLLAQDPTLSAAKLGGGLDIWLFRNMEKILEWSGSARDSQQSCAASPNPGCVNFVQRQATRILDYLDGPYVTQENIPTTIQSPTNLLVDPTIAKVSLLEFTTNQTPPGYLKHIGNHLRSLIQVPALSASQRTLTLQISTAINNVQGWLTTVRADAAKIVHMTPDQLVQPSTSSLLDELFTTVNFAFVGQINPNTNQVKEGVVQIHYNIQRLATFDITACGASKAANPCL